MEGVVKCPKEAPWSKHTYYVYVIETPEGTRDKLQEFLKQRGIGTNIHYKFPTHKVFISVNFFFGIRLEIILLISTNIVKG